MNIREMFGKKRLLSQKGLTLVEMLVAMLIFSVILIGTLLLIKYLTALLYTIH